MLSDGYLHKRDGMTRVTYVLCDGTTDAHSPISVTSVKQGNNKPTDGQGFFNELSALLPVFCSPKNAGWS
jgi:dsRNA-specific ribonuclease